ncbi:hypothetical protein PGB90_005474 [Kerria lacca]
MIRKISDVSSKRMASQKLKLNSSPHRKKRRGSATDDGASATIKGIGGFSNLLHRNSPAIPSALLRKIGQKEATGIGKSQVSLFGTVLTYLDL